MPIDLVQKYGGQSSGQASAPIDLVAKYGGQQAVTSPQEQVNSQQEQIPEIVSHEQGVTLQTGQPETTATGLIGAATRGAAPYAVAAGTGALLGGGIPGAVAGTGAYAIADVLGDPVVMGVNKLLGTKYTLPSEALSDLFTKMGVPEPDTEAERIVESTTKGAAGAGGFASLGSMLSKSSIPAIQKFGSMLAQQPTAQVVGGATGGTAGQAAEEAGVGTIGQLAASMAGGMAGAKAATLRNVGVPSVIEEANKVGVRALTTDVLPPDTPQAKLFQVISEKIPFFGTGGVRAAQKKERIEAVKSFLEDYSAINPSESLTDDLMNEFLKKRGEIVSKYSTDKKNIIDNVSALAGERSYPKAVQTINDQIDYLNSIESSKLKPFIKQLEELRDTLPGKDLNIAESKRKLLGDSLKAEDLANVKSEADKSYNKIYSALNEDIGDTIKQFGGRKDYDKWKVANKRLSNMMDELGVTNIKAVLKKGNYEPEAIYNMLSRTKRSSNQRLYRNLTPEGKAIARTAVISRVAKDSMTDGEINPKKFINAINKESKSIGVFFNKQQKDRTEGLIRALNATRRADVADNNPLLVSSLQFLSGSALMHLLGTVPSTVAVTAGAGMLARIFESRAVRNILTRLPRTTPGSKEEAALLKRLASTLQSQKVTNNE